jgi:mono/diheme cytochrome c family protein
MDEQDGQDTTTSGGRSSILCILFIHVKNVLALPALPCGCHETGYTIAMRIKLLGGAMLLVAPLVLTAAVWAFDDSWPVPKEAAERANPLTASSPYAKKAHTIYNNLCTPCHGDKGDGKGEEAEALRVPPADFTSAALMLPMSDGEVFYKITKGRNPMPSFEAKLTDQERWGLVLYLRTFLKGPPTKKK